MKDDIIILRIEETNKKEIMSYCKKHGISLSELLREAACEKTNKLTKEQYSLDKQLKGEINRIGNNINQIAKNYNSNRYLLDSEKERLFQYLDKLEALINEHNEFDRKKFYEMLNK
ncbi:MAG: MobC family plasmid mobilization relaxosome protein [Lachnospiraceae bacterium]|nr:MobC family plasmid mobilization relaxosome protein [Lachnospiraceae bacterium]